MFTVSHFLTSHKSWNEIYDDFHFNLWFGIDNGIEMLGMAFWAYRTIDVCLHQSGYWSVVEGTRMLQEESDKHQADENAQMFLAKPKDR